MKNKVMHIQVRSVPQEPTEGEQELLFLMKAEIKSKKETEVPPSLNVLKCTTSGTM